MRWNVFKSLIAALLSTSRRVDGIYISYEKARSYAEGDPIPLLANKLISSDSLTSMDYAHLQLCGNGSKSVSSVRGSNAWEKALTSLHGDSLYEVNVFHLLMKTNLYCQQLCITDLTDMPYNQAIAKNMHYNFLVDGMPVAFRHETDQIVSIRYWGGVPVGQQGKGEDDYVDDDDTDPRYNESLPQELFVYNHFNFYITYWKVPSSDKQFRVVRTEVQPFSIAHRFDQTATAVPTDLYDSSIPSCLLHNVPTYYDSLNGTEPQVLPFHRKVLFTYDVIWREYVSSQDPWDTRWNVFLRMDDGIPLEVQLFGLLVAVLINAILFLSLWTWLMRDLSYKPIMSVVLDEDELAEDQVEEMKLWPLSTRLFFPPRVLPLSFCICCGIGAQLLVCCFIFVLLFRTGVINESMGANILTPAVIIYTLSSFVGGSVTTRFYGLFHGNKIRAIQACFAVAALFPSLGLLVIFLTYDVLRPETAPNYHVVSTSIPLILIWLLLIFPLTFLGGWLGYRKGPMHNFPVSEGSKGYQDLALQNDNDDNDESQRRGCCCWKHSRIFVVILTAGLAPVACSFVEYAYGVAGPIYVGYFSDSSFFAVLSFLFYCTCVAFVAALLLYQQIRFQNYEWWWSAFVAGVSSGFYLFILSTSWLVYDATTGYISGQSMASYTLWFAFGSLGAAFIAGFVSVLSCMLLMRLLYAFLMRRASREVADDESVRAEETQDVTVTETSPQGSYNLQSIMDLN